MKLSKLLKQVLQEKKGDTYDTGCVMLNLNAPQIKVIQDHIKPEDLYTEEGDRTYGLEDEPHCTLLYGLSEGPMTDDIKSILDNYTFKPLVLKNASLFIQEDYEVFKLDVIGENLSEINEDLCEYPHSNKFPEYHPHVTIAYLKPGTGDRYVKALAKGSWKVLPENAVYSQVDGSKDTITVKLAKED